MNQQEQQLLNKMKRLIKEGKRYFEIRKDRDYLQDLEEIDISEEEAWNIIESLNFHFYFIDTKPYYNRTNNVLVFKRPINKIIVYIKLKIENLNNNEYTICISFHRDYKEVIK